MWSADEVRRFLAATAALATIFSGALQSRPAAQDALNSDLSKADLEAMPRLRFHDLRHTCATLLLRANVHPKVVQERLGHVSIRLTMDTYSHLLPGMQTEAAAILGYVIAGVSPTASPTNVKLRVVA